mgnify:CR=1 FL=1
MFKKLVSFILLFLLFFSNLNLSFADEDLPIIDSSIQEENIIPDIIITFQSASYLTDKDIIQDTYYCDLNKDVVSLTAAGLAGMGGTVEAAPGSTNERVSPFPQETKPRETMHIMIQVNNPVFIN